MSFWGVVRSLPQRERFASERLEDAGFETFLPLLQTKRASTPLFAGHLFVLIVDRSGDQQHAWLFMFGQDRRLSGSMPRP